MLEEDLPAEASALFFLTICNPSSRELLDSRDFRRGRTSSLLTLSSASIVVLNMLLSNKPHNYSNRAVDKACELLFLGIRLPAIVLRYAFNKLENQLRFNPYRE